MPVKPPAFDDENPEWTDEDFRRAKPAAELPPDILAALPNTERGGPAAVPVLISRDVVSHFKAKGPGWEKRFDALLRNAMKDE